MIAEFAATATDPGCAWVNPLCVVGDAVGQLASAVQNKALGEVAGDFLNSWAGMEMYLLASWIALPLLVDLTNPNGTAQWLQDNLAYFTAAFAVVGVLVAAGYTIVTLGLERLKTLGLRLGVLMLVSTGGTALVVALDDLARRSSLWLLGQVGVTPTSGLVSGAAAAAGSLVGATFIIAALGIVAVILQWGIMIVRQALIIVAVGVWPMLAAAATIGEKASQGFTTVTSWLVAFLIYPFPAAIVYAAAFKLKSGHDGIAGMMFGLVLELLALFMLPALLRIFAPQVQALGSAWGGQMAIKAAAQITETAVTVGAMVLTAGAAGAAAGGAAGRSAIAASAGGGGGASAAAAGASGTSAGSGAASVAEAPAAATGAERTAPDTASADANTTPSVGSPVEGSGADHLAETTPAVQAASSGADAPPVTASPSSSPDSAAKHAAASPVPGDGQPGPDRRYQYQQAAQAAAQNASRTARDGMDDLDDVIGGKHV